MIYNFFSKIKYILFQSLKWLCLAFIFINFTIAYIFILVWKFIKILGLFLLFSNNSTSFLYIKKSFDLIFFFFLIVRYKGFLVFLIVFSALIHSKIFPRRLYTFMFKSVPIIRLVCIQIIRLFWSKHKKWIENLTQKGLLLQYFNLSFNFSFILYLYIASVLISFVVFCCFCLIHIYIYALTFSLIFLVCHIFFKNFIYMLHIYKNKIIPFFLQVACEFIVLLNEYLCYLNTVLTNTILINSKIGEKKKLSKNTFIKSIVLYMLSTNVSKLYASVDNFFFSYFYPHKNVQGSSGSEEIPGLLSTLFKKRIEIANSLKRSNDLTEVFTNFYLKKNSSNFQETLISNLLKSYTTNTPKFNFILRLRSIMKNTKYPGNNLEFKKLWAFYYNKGTPLRLLDMLQGTFWLKNSEESLVDARYSEEAKYAYHKKHGRPVKLIYHYFKDNLLSSNTWSIFFSFIKKERKLTQNVIDVLSAQDTSVYKLKLKHYKQTKQKKEWNKDLRHNKYDVINSIFFDIFASKMPLFLSFFSNLNYMLLLLFGELFGSVFESNLNKVFNLYKIKESMDVVEKINWKWMWLAKGFWFIVYDGWVLVVKFLFTSFLWLRTKLVKDTLSVFVLSKCIVFFLFLLQYFEIDGRKSIYFFFILHWQDFLKFNFEKSTFVKKPWLKTWGWPAVLFEQLGFFFFFIIIMFLDFFLLLYYVLLRIKIFYYSFIFLQEFIKYFFFILVVYILLPSYEFLSLCNDIYTHDTKINAFDLKKNKTTNFYFYNNISDMQKNFVQIKFFIFLLKKYWWDLSMENERGLKRIPFFYKYSKNFVWFDRFLAVLSDVFFLFSYYLSVLKEKAKDVYFQCNEICLSLWLYPSIFFKYMWGCLFVLCLEIYLFFYKFMCKSKVKKTSLQLKYRLINTFFLRKKSIYRVDEEFSNRLSFWVFNKNMTETLVISPLSKLKINNNEPSFNAQEILKALYGIKNKPSAKIFNTKNHGDTYIKIDFLYKILDYTKVSQGAPQSFIISSKDIKKLISFQIKHYYKSSWIWKKKPIWKINGFYRYALLKNQGVLFNSELNNLRFRSLDRIYFSVFVSLFKKRLLIPYFKFSYSSLEKNINILTDLFNRKFQTRVEKKIHTRDISFFKKVWKNFSFFRTKTHNNNNKEKFFYSFLKTETISTFLFNDYSHINKILHTKNISTYFEEKIPEYEYLQNFFVNICIYFLKKSYSIYIKEQVYFIYLFDFIVFNKIKLSKYIRNIRFSLKKNFPKPFKEPLMVKEHIGFLNFSILNFAFYNAIIKKFLFKFLFLLLQFWLYTSDRFFFKTFYKNEAISLLYKDMKFLYIFGFDILFLKKINKTLNKINYPIQFQEKDKSNKNAFDFYVKRYRKYLELDFNIEFRDFLTALKLRHALISDMELLWGDIFKIKFFQARMSSKNLFNFSGNLLNRTYNILAHNIKWFDFKSRENPKPNQTITSYSCLDFNVIFTENHENTEKRLFDKSFFFFDVIFFVYKFYQLKLGLSWFLFRFKFFFIKYRWDQYIILLFFFFFFIMFGFNFFFSINFWVIFSSWIFSLLYFIKIWISWFVINIFAFLDLSLGNIIREFFEFVFYYQILQEPFMEQLVGLNLYGIFMYCINHLALFEGDGLNFLRLLWIIYASFIVKVGCFYYEFISWFLFLSFYLKDFFLIYNIWPKYTIIFFTTVDLVLLEYVCYFYSLGISCFWIIVCFTEYGFNFFWLLFMAISHFYCDIYSLVYTQILYIFEYINIFNLNIIKPFVVPDSMQSILYNIKSYYSDIVLYWNFFFINHLLILNPLKIDSYCFISFWYSVYVLAITFIQMLCELLAFIFWSFLWMIIVFLEFLLAGLYYIIYYIQVIQVLFFKSFFSKELFFYIIQLFGWFYLNVFYYTVITPFISLVFYIFICIKYLVYFPYLIFIYTGKVISLVFITVLNIFYLFFWFITKIIWFFDVFFIKSIYIPLSKILTTFMFENLAYFNIPYVFWSFCQFVLSCCLSLIFFMCAPIFSLIYYFCYLFTYSFYPFFLLYAYFYTILLFLLKYWVYFFFYL